MQNEYKQNSFFTISFISVGKQSQLFLVSCNKFSLFKTENVACIPRYNVIYIMAEQPSYIIYSLNYLNSYNYILTHRILFKNII